jgi:hypothetical protein
MGWLLPHSLLATHLLVAAGEQEDIRLFFADCISGADFRSQL